MGLSTHILDTTRGRPASGVTVRVERLDHGQGHELGRGVTNDDGRVKPLLETFPSAGTYRLHFEVGAYFAKQNVEAFFPSVVIDFEVKSPGEHYHVPLLLNPFGYSTYRGS